MPKITKIGIEIGDHHKIWPTLAEQVAQVPDEKLGNFLLIYHKPGDENGNCMPKEEWVHWAKILADAKIYFAFLYTQREPTPNGRGTQFDPDLCAAIEEAANGYFIGDMIGETGGWASHYEGYFARHDYAPAATKTMQEAVERYVDFVKDKCDRNHAAGIKTVMSVEATILHSYNALAGVALPCTELMPGDPDINLAGVRGAARAYNCKEWGSHIAHEWYGGFDIEDTLKQKRLRNSLYTSYVAGADYIYLESGLFEYRGYGQSYEYDDPICQLYRDELRNLAADAEANPLPEEGPIVPLGILQGNHAEWSDFGSCHVWNHFGDDKWVYGDEEMSWELLVAAMYQGAPWHRTTVMGAQDYSAQPPCGQYDIVPIFAGAQALKRYPALLMLGHNTMTPEIYADLVEYVKSGGHLVISLPHFRTNSDRTDEMQLINDGDLSELCGVKILPGATHFDAGFKFVAQPEGNGWQIPLMGDLNGDPICSTGTVSLANIEECGAKRICEGADTFIYEGGTAVIYENRIGEGSVLFTTAYDYPGAQGMYKLMRVLIEAAKTGEQCNPRVVAGDKIRYGVYRENGETTVMAYNTDFDLAQSIKIVDGEKSQSYMLDSGEFKAIKLG